MSWAIAMSVLIGQASASPIRSDERVVFFPTFAVRNSDGQSWRVPIHGWVYEPEFDSPTRSTSAALFRAALGLVEGEERSAVFMRRASLFLVDNERGKRLTIRFGDRAFALRNASAANGHFEETLELPDGFVRGLSQRSGKSEQIHFAAILPAGDARSFAGRVHLLGPTGLSVISDIDDTIKITNVRDMRALLTNTFLREFAAVDKMARLYRRWEEAGASFHYVSSSPWQLYGELASFLQADGFPPGTFDLRLFRWKDESFFNLFASPEVTKPQAIEPILRTLPGRKFLLVGDSGEKDPEVYAELARRHPEQIVAIYIRDVTNEPAESPRYKSLFGGLPRGLWRVFKDPDELPLPPAL